MPLDIISGKQNTSKCVHSTLVISDKREAAEAPGSAGRAGLRAHTATRRPRAGLQRGAPPPALRAARANAGVSTENPVAGGQHSAPLPGRRAPIDILVHFSPLILGCLWKLCVQNLSVHAVSSLDLLPNTESDFHKRLINIFLRAA